MSYVRTYSVVRAVCQDLPGSTTGEIEARSLLFVNMMMLLVRDDLLVSRLKDLDPK
jgi:hypothetical protein